ncbi:MAG: DNA repair protein RadC [Oscillospiraceae bacterium]|nr:DNA repair protein RadC [Oscillospiraceae bacterium]
MSIHEGHRQRLKGRFRKEGLDNFDELYVLELLLFYCVPRRDTNPLAHTLLEKFGSLTGVLNASREELEKVDGINANISTFLSLIMQVGRYYQVKQNEPGKILRTIEQCGNYLVPYFVGREVETVFLLCLDAKCKVICCKKVGEGSVNSANIPVRRIVEMALAVNATTVILAHNHPSGLAIPSADDIQTTHRVAKALEAVEMILADHIVVCKDDYVSLVQSQLYKPQDCCSI